MFSVTDLENAVAEVEPRPSPPVEERRTARRVDRKLDVHVKPLGSAQPIVARTKDISEGGMFFVVPSSEPISVGQRCELEPRDETARASLGELSAGFYATVIRTRPLAHGETQMVGAGVRFDQPIFLT